MLSAQKEMNFLLSEWSNKQPNLWEVIRTQTSLVSGTATYTLPAYTVMILDASVVLNYGLQNESRRAKIKFELAKIIVSLGGPGASRRAAAAILSLFA